VIFERPLLKVELEAPTKEFLRLVLIVRRRQEREGQESRRPAGWIPPPSGLNCGLLLGQSVVPPGGIRRSLQSVPEVDDPVDLPLIGGQGIGDRDQLADSINIVGRVDGGRVGCLRAAAIKTGVVAVDAYNRLP